MAICKVTLNNITRTNGQDGLWQFGFNFTKQGIEHITLQEFFSSAPQFSIIYQKIGDTYYNANNEYLDEVNLNNDYYVWKEPVIDWSKEYECLDNEETYLIGLTTPIIVVGSILLLSYLKNKK